MMHAGLDVTTHGTEAAMYFSQADPTMRITSKFTLIGS